MKHLVLAPLYPPLRYGGIEIIVERLCSALASIDEVVVVALNPQAATVGHRWHGPVQVWDVPGHFFSPLAADAANSAALEIIRPLRRDVDIIHCHDWFLADAACTLAGENLPLLGFFHTVKALEGTHVGGAGTPARRYAEEKQARLASRADVVAVYSQFMHDSVSDHFDIKVDNLVRFMCGPTLPLGHRPSVAARSNKGLNVTYVGRLAAEKGVDHLLNAFVDLHRHQPGHSLRVIGSGPDAQALMHRASQEPDARIAFEPLTSDPSVLMNAYLAADLVVVPSRFEPYGLVAAEALTLGVPVAVASTGGLPEIVRGGLFGDVFSVGGREELTNLLVAATARPPADRQRAELGRRVHGDPSIWHDAARQLRACVLGEAVKCDS